MERPIPGFGVTVLLKSDFIPENILVLGGPQQQQQKTMHEPQQPDIRVKTRLVSGSGSGSGSRLGSRLGSSKNTTKIWTKTLGIRMIG